MTKTVTRTEDITRIQRSSDAEEVARAVYTDLMRLLVSLEPDDWTAPTECHPWTVADIVRHLLGAAKSHASLRRQIRELRHSRKHADRFDGSTLDAMNDLQVRDHADLGPMELIAELDDVWSAAVRGRMSKPGLVRALSVPNDNSGSTPAGTGDRVRVANLLDAILSRDVWLHRIDISHATGRPVNFGPTDRRIIEDVIAEWASLLDDGFDLTIETPFAARYVSGDGEHQLLLDGIELSRILSGRATHPSPLFDTKVLF